MILSLNLTELDEIQSSTLHRSRDSGLAVEHIRRALDGLQLHVDDPNTRGLAADLSNVVRSIERVAPHLSDRAREVRQFRERVAEIDRGSGRGWGRMLPWVPRLRALNVQQPTYRFASIMTGLARIGPRIRSFAGLVVRPGIRLFRNTVSFASGVKNGVVNAGRAVQRTFVNTIRSIVSWTQKKWKQTTDAFRRAWDAAWATFQHIKSGIVKVSGFVVRKAREAGRVVVGTGKALINMGSLAWKMLTSRFDPPPKPWSETVTSETDLDAELKIDVPTPWKFEIRLNPSVHVKVKQFDDGSSEVTVGAEFAAGIVAKLGNDLSPEAKAKVEAAVMAALGGERTYRIVGDPMLFLAQLAARAILQGIADMGGADGFAAGQLLKRMPPTPEPVRSSVYMKVSAEISAEISVGGAGAKASAKAEIEFRGTVNSDATSFLEVTASASAAASGTIGGKFLGSAGVGFDGEVKSTFKIQLGTDGLPTAIEVSAEFETRTAATSEHASAGSATVHTSTTTMMITADDRAEISRLVQGLPGTGADLLRRLGSMAGNADTVTTEKTYDYVATEASLGGSGPVSAEWSSETRTNFHETTN